MCYKCIADAKIGPCADPFKLHGRKHFQENCESDWCVKLEVGALSKNGPWTIGTGHIERRCWKKPMPDNQERCQIINYKGAQAHACFCKGLLCNTASTKNTFVFLIFPFLIVLNQFI